MLLANRLHATSADETVVDPSFNLNLPHKGYSVYATDFQCWSYKIRTGKAKPVLSEYLFSRNAVDETFIPRHTDNNSGLVAPRTWLTDDTLDDFETWARLFDPSQIEFYFTKSGHALANAHNPDRN
ncbi:Uncharacterized protein TCAP_06854 [Tolypocladium capitatum]|uniref:Uncharacterized protein n=1 Tax=Tolypocladium capitatum TaxID=45235 RepID=A0A2K3Q6Q7_9HYPO|nr:Uncharacterized protein TCAP_06854 [Tolypocladium capitatum]